MSPTEAIPLLIVVLLMVSIGGGEVEQLTVSFQGEQALEANAGVHVVAGGTSTVTANDSLSSDIYIIGGTARIAGVVDGDVTLLAGNLSIVSGATVTGTVQTIAGDSAIADDASIGSVSVFEAPAADQSPIRRLVFLFLQFLVLGAVGWWLVTRHPFLLENVGHSIVNHALVSGVVGALAAVTLLVLFVYMAFTILLIPVSIVGLLGELVIALYGQVVLGYLLGTRLPIDREPLATVAGIGVFLLGLELLGLLPYVGVLVQLGLLVVGFGAVLNTYFGLRHFEPVRLPGGAEE